MLAKANRITHGTDYKSTVRSGRRVVGKNTIVYFRHDAAGGPARFGFIVGKPVGIAVRRNLVRRRLKAICRELLRDVPAGTDLVVRALPASSTAAWVTLQGELSRAVSSQATSTSKGGARS